MLHHHHRFSLLLSLPKGFSLATSSRLKFSNSCFKSCHLVKQYLNYFLCNISDVFHKKALFSFTNLRKLMYISHYNRYLWFRYLLNLWEKYWHESALQGNLKNHKIKMLFKTEKQSWNLNYLEQLFFSLAFTNSVLTGETWGTMASSMKLFSGVSKYQGCQTNKFLEKSFRLNQILWQPSLEKQRVSELLK